MEKFDLLRAFETEQESHPFSFLYAAIFSTLRHAIITEAYLPGDRLKDGDLAKLLGVSRTPVTRAFNMLTEEGLLAVNEKGEYLVTAQDYGLLRNTMTVRCMVEPVLGYQAAKDSSRQDLAELKELLQVFKGLDELEDPAEQVVAAFRAETAFFTKVCSTCRNPYIRNTYNDNLTQIYRSIYAIDHYWYTGGKEAADVSLYEYFSHIYYSIKSHNGRMAMEAVYSQLRRVDIRNMYRT